MIVETNKYVEQLMQYIIRQFSRIKDIGNQ